MASTVYISTIEPDAGKSIVSLGLVDLLLRQSPRIAYFRPIVSSTEDAHLRLILDHFRLRQSARDTYAFTYAEANVLLGNEWCVRPSQDLIERLGQLVGREGVELIYGQRLADGG